MTQRVIVISDLHIAAPGLLNNFHAGTALAKFCAMIARPNTTLVLAGDIFDFLQVEDRSAVFDNAIMPALICGTLDAVASESWGQAFFAALGDLIRRGGRCVVLPGNHDPELVHPIFKEQLCARIGLPVGLTGLDIHTRGPWYTRLGEREVVVGHGHRIDSWNNIDPAMMDAVLNGEPLQLPPGSRLVTQVLNAFKNACDATGLPRFPFVDLLKPEVPAVPLLLLYLDRKLAMQHLPAALGLSIESIANAVGRAIHGGVTLASANASVAPSPADDIALAIAMTYTDVQRTNPARCKEQLIEWLNGMDEGLGEGRLASHSGLRARMLRAFLWLASDNGRFFDQSHRSADCIAISREYLPPGAPPRVVISGHTHAAREVWLTPDHVYINTGTWTDLMKLPSRIDDAMLKEWIDSLERREIPRIQRLTYADVTATDVALREFRP